VPELGHGVAAATLLVPPMVTAIKNQMLVMGEGITAKKVV
jgi:hypothetical protein